MNELITAFLPCRRDSERIKNKNIRQFADEEKGLIGIKMEQLLHCREIDQIVVSTDDQRVMEICQDMAKYHRKPVRIVERPPELATSIASTDELIDYVPTLISEGSVLWTHVTSPFVDELVYGDAIVRYCQGLQNGSGDSLMSVSRLQTFIWNESGAVNYNRTREKWPRTQTLPVWYEVNSAIFLSPVAIYKNRTDRIGDNPILYELKSIASVDIDWEEDFFLAEKLWKLEK